MTYCTCGAFFYRNKTVAVIGEGQRRGRRSVTAQVAKTVYLIHRRPTRSAPSHYWVQKVKEDEHCHGARKYHHGSTRQTEVTGVKLEKPFNERSQKILALDGVFIEVGSIPNGAHNKIGCKLDDKGFMQVDAAVRSTVKVFSALAMSQAAQSFCSVYNCCR